MVSPPAAGGTSWKLAALYAFQGGEYSGADPSDGSQPIAPVVLGASGDLYGTTITGGTKCSLTPPAFVYNPNFPGCGTVFRLSPPAAGKTEWTETVLYRFTGGDDGAFPIAGLLLRDGVLYGTAAGGGRSGKGTVFEIVP